jgi:hypothetical protein
LCEARRDRPQAFAPVRQRECELVRQRRCDSANAVRQLAEIASRKLAIVQEIEQKGVYFTPLWRKGSASAALGGFSLAR